MRMARSRNSDKYLTTDQMRGDVQIVAIDSIQQHPQNPRRGDIEAIRRSIREHGFYGAVVVQKATGYIIKGNHVWAACKAEGFEHIRAELLDYDDNEAMEVVLMDNWTSDQGSYDYELLLRNIDAVKNNTGSLDNTGYSDDAINIIIKDLKRQQSAVSVDEVAVNVNKAVELQKKWKVEYGQVWQIGNHRLMCGDSTSMDDVQQLLDGSKIDGAFTSPPYAEQRKKQYGGIPSDKYVEWWNDIQSIIADHGNDHCSFFVNIKPHSKDGERSLYVADLVLAMVRIWGWSFVDEFCWLRGGVPRQVTFSFKNAFEPVYHFAKKQKGFRFNPDAVMAESDSVPIPGGPGVGNTNWASKQGHGGGSLSDLQGHQSWIFGSQQYAPGKAYPSNVLPAWTNDETRGHEAAFPVKLPSFFIKAYSDQGDIWYDPFLGSGTTMVAAEQLNRKCYGMEIEPKYCAVILERMSTLDIQGELING